MFIKGYKYNLLTDMTVYNWFKKLKDADYLQNPKSLTHWTPQFGTSTKEKETFIDAPVYPTGVKHGFFRKTRTGYNGNKDVLVRAQG